MNFTALEETLKRKGFAVASFSTAAEAADYLDRELDGKTVGIGGSDTIKTMGLAERLRKHNTVYWHWLPDQKQAHGADAVRRMAMDTQVYLTSVNALAETGLLVNIDGTGNRIASISFGHEKVYVLVGRNKITPDLDSALWRARNVAAPKNAQRLGYQTPCAVKGDRCYDCNSPDRLCRGFLITERPMRGTEMEIVLIDEELGA
ncbi:MAG: lactate utilization protein [Clostridiaceae bacterium]|nr:lactate utilization protein [Clostridiaceae bacterium]